MAYSIGVLVGVLVMIGAIALIVIAICKLGNKDRKVKTEYDERQKIAIGEGYKIAYWTLAALLVVVQMYKTLALSFGTDYLAKTDFGIIAFSMIIISVMVFCVYCIFNGAYWGINNNKTSYVVVIGAIGLFNLAIAIGAMVRGNFIDEDALSGAFVNLMCALLMFVVLGAAGIKDIVDKNNADDEEDDEADDK